MCRFAVRNWLLQVHVPRRFEPGCALVWRATRMAKHYFASPSWSAHLHPTWLNKDLNMLCPGRARQQ